MIIHKLEKSDSILNTFIAQLRAKDIQKDAMRFRRNIERIGEVIAYELSKSLHYKVKKIITPLGVKKINLITNNLVICSILRAGLPLHQGLLNYFDAAENAYISAFRRHTNSNEFEIVVEYFASPTLENKTLILADPMLATGNSLVAVYNALLKHGKPKKIHIVAVIGASQGIDFIKKHFPKNTELWIATVDDKLNKKGYIIPGLGDAGDLAFGEKL
ncbi:MAG: uracil phosphoribosyltransferase [Flavobacteriaceae bacterium]|nr:uracil phosphoribosyltransferase [Flavobacteriaceae bacterium]